MMSRGNMRRMMVQLLGPIGLLIIIVITVAYRSDERMSMACSDSVDMPHLKVKYPSYTNLVMAGYQGWHAAHGDESNRGWYHYKKNGCGFFPGCTNVDLWPDVTDYAVTYETPFRFADGTPAYVYSPYDSSTVDIHFKWMKEYGLDGVHMQRFVNEVKPASPKGKRHFNHVLKNALTAAKKYDRAISIMYDLSGCAGNDVAFVEEDWRELVETFRLFDSNVNPTYLRHNGKPLVSIWGVGFNDHRGYSLSDVSKLVDKLIATGKVSIMLGVPYYWRTFGRDTENNVMLHDLLKKVDIVMPWAVGRYKSGNYNSENVAEDARWCEANGLDYVPLVFPGFSWANMHDDPRMYNAIPREHGDFLWEQIAGAKKEGAKALYVAMFDEIDEGTAIYKIQRESRTPLNGDKGLKFVGVEDDVDTDYYLWLTGQGARWFHGKGEYGQTKPLRPAMKK